MMPQLDSLRNARTAALVVVGDLTRSIIAAEPLSSPGALSWPPWSSLAPTVLTGGAEPALWREGPQFFRGNLQGQALPGRRQKGPEAAGTQSTLPSLRPPRRQPRSGSDESVAEDGLSLDKLATRAMRAGIRVAGIVSWGCAIGLSGSDNSMTSVLKWVISS